MKKRLARMFGPITKQRAEAREAYAAEIAARTEHAEAALRGDAVSVPGVIYSGLQEAGVYSADPELDASPEVAAKAKHLFSLVKEFSVSPSGDWETAVVDREIQTIGEGQWCVNCGSPQDFTEAEWEERMVRLEGVIGPRPKSASRECNCPVCGFKLGYHGIVPADGAQLSLSSFTDEQQAIIHEMFPGAFDEDGERIPLPSDQVDSEDDEGTPDADVE